LSFMASCAASGTNCSCNITANLAPATENGTYSVSGTTLALAPMTSTSGMMNGGSYCVQGNTLHLITVPQDGGGTGPGMSSSDFVATKQ
jgi:hypothetical protein